MSICIQQTHRHKKCFNARIIYYLFHIVLPLNKKFTTCDHKFYKKMVSVILLDVKLSRYSKAGFWEEIPINEGLNSLYLWFNYVQMEIIWILDTKILDWKQEQQILCFKSIKRKELKWKWFYVFNIG